MDNLNFAIPENCLGADLFWWQERAGLHTLITIVGELESTNRLAPGTLSHSILSFALFDTAGQLRASWREQLGNQQTLFIDSQRHPLAATRAVAEGVLAVFVSSSAPLPAEARQRYQRLYSLIDWYSEEGEIVSLHNDQSIRFASRELDFTEIVLRETAAERNYLVILNGAVTQPPNSLRLRFTNQRGEVHEVVYPPAMPPLTLHKLFLAELFPELADFCAGDYITLEGRFAAHGVFTRPYVMTQGKHLSGYHGGNLYHWRGFPQVAYRFLGRGEVNPMVALHNRELTTTVNLLNSHGDLEEDFWVDARLYDQAGQLVTERKQWLLAKRRQLSRGEIAELLPDPAQAFIGHIALNFSQTKRAWYPGRLQALLEYRTAQSVARVMAWSDVWNGRQRVETLKQGLPPGFAELLNVQQPEEPLSFRCYYRVWCRPPLVSYLAVTNCGVTPDYTQTIQYNIRLENGVGKALNYPGSLAPQATAFGPIDWFFPQAETFLRGQPAGLVIVESTADLAVMHFTKHQTSGVYSAEHFMALQSFANGSYYYPCGA